jgi:hypothetical protein
MHMKPIKVRIFLIVFLIVVLLLLYNGYDNFFCNLHGTNMPLYGLNAFASDTCPQFGVWQYL